jgi:EmrB/QacA subfamily drug resistance transporter
MLRSVRKSGGSGQLTTRRAWAVLAVTSVTVVVIFVNASGLNVALPAMSRDLAATGSQPAWFLLSYMLVATAFMLVFGRLADIFGRRPLYVGGIVVFLAGTLACGLAPSAELFIVFRFVQGIGAASVITNNTAILTDTFPPALLSRGLGINATVAAVGQVLGPVIGGLVVELLGWRWMFLLAVPLLALGLVASMKLIPRASAVMRHERMDVPGALLSVGGLGALVLFVDEMSDADGFSSPWAWGAGLGAATLVVAFTAVQRHRKFPLIDLSIFNKSTVLLYLSGFLCSFSNFAVVLLTSLHLQGSLGLTAMEAGLLVVPSPIGTTIAALCSGRLTQRIHHATLTGTGMMLIGLGTTTVAFSIGFEWPQYGMAAGLFIVGLGTGLFMTPNTSALMLTVPSGRRGIANAVRSTLQNAGYLFSTSIALGTATILLTPADRTDAYAGRLSVAGGDVGSFDVGILIALGVLVAAAAGGAVAAFATRHSTSQTADEPVDDQIDAGASASR